MSRPLDLTGQRFGKLLVVAREPSPSSQRKWRCACDCGQTSVVFSGNLRRGLTRSCGCVMRMSAKLHSTTHGYATGRKAGQKTRREYSAWTHAKQRCHNPRNPQFGDYGARGITMCDRWRASFAAFIADMGPCPDRLTLDRIDNALGYQPGNCRWVDMGVQQRNRRDNVILDAFGRRQTLAEWGRESGIKAARIKRRLLTGWPIERALTEPVRAW